MLHHFGSFYVNTWTARLREMECKDDECLAYTLCQLEVMDLFMEKVWNRRKTIFFVVVVFPFVVQMPIMFLFRHFDPYLCRYWKIALFSFQFTRMYSLLHGKMAKETTCILQNGISMSMLPIVQYRWECRKWIQSITIQIEIDCLLI